MENCNLRANQGEATMGYTVTDTVSCRLLPTHIAELRELAATEEVSLSRFVSGLCLTAIQDRKQNKKSPTHLEDATDVPAKV
jgi:hypothetical protein